VTPLMEVGLFFLGQSIVLLGAGVAAFVKLKVAVAKCEMAVKHVDGNTTRIEKSHTKLSDKVDGISKHVTQIEAKLA